jgi:hypothetical protein
LLGAGALVCMKWVRSNVKHGSRLALFALAIQFVLSFGHFHGVAAEAAPVIAPGAVPSASSCYAESLAPYYAKSMAAQNAASQDSAIDRVQPQPTSDHEQDEPSDGCSICAVMALANAVLFASPPVLLLPQAVAFLYRSTEAGFVHLNSARVAFQPRAPPAS